MLLNLSDMKSVFGMSVVCVVELVYAEALTPYVLDHSINPAKLRAEELNHTGFQNVEEDSF
jgi:hypothetical protein